MYNKVELLGEGSYGEVYHAIRIIEPGMLAHWKDDAVAIKRNYACGAYVGSISALRELDILNKVKEHPFCIHMREATFNPPFEMKSKPSLLAPEQPIDKVFFVLEKGGCDGSKFLHRNPAPSLQERLLFFTHTLLATEYLHSRNMFHRDIKPENIICFFDKNGKLESAKLSDFGLTQYRSNQMLETFGMVTLWYRAPEIALYKPYDSKVDVWSLGCMMHEAYTVGSLRIVSSVSEDYELLNLLMEKMSFSDEDIRLAKTFYPKHLRVNKRNHKERFPEIYHKEVLPL